MINPMLNTTLLHNLDNDRNRVTYAKLISLNIDSLPIEQIEGVFTGGSITVDGASSVRRICNLTMTTKNLNTNNIYWGLSSRIKIEVGLKNRVDDSYDDIVWLPLGVFILTDFKTSQQVNNYTISLTGKDKMCLLNGDVGGVFNAETDLGIEKVQQTDGHYEDVHIPIYTVIKKMVHHYAQDPYKDILISDIDNLALTMLSNKNGDSNHPSYLIWDITNDEFVEIIYPDEIGNYSSSNSYYTDSYYQNDETQIDFSTIAGNDKFITKTNLDEDDTGLIDSDNTDNVTHFYLPLPETSEGEVAIPKECIAVKIEYGEDIGYTLQELYYPEDLIASVGETVTSILDKIINTFGEYEYFYNVYGQFVFQAKQTYVNTSWNNRIRRENNETYIDPSQVSSYVKYSFEGNNLTTAYQNNPNIGKIKNDYTVWGNRKSKNSDVDFPIHMRYAIDKKPYFYQSFTGKIYLTNKEMLLDVIRKQYSDLAKKAKTVADTFEFSHPVPSNLEMPVHIDGGLFTPGWWDIRDWHDFYVSLTGLEPMGTMKWYSTNDETGYTDVSAVTKSQLPSYAWLIVDNGRGNYSTGHGGCGDSLIGKTYECTYYESTIDSNGKVVTNKIVPELKKVFYYPYAGCSDTHTFLYFLHQDVEQGRPVYFYNPNFTGLGFSFGDNTGEETEEEQAQLDSLLLNSQLGANVIVCDWREIIYQMAKDYYLHGDEDDFYVNLHKNNMHLDWGIDLYLNGLTGYEQYYHDMEAFWRYLYIPEEEREKYFNSLRYITLSDVTTSKIITCYVTENGEVIHPGTGKTIATIIKATNIPSMKYPGYNYVSCTNSETEEGFYASIEYDNTGAPIKYTEFSEARKNLYGNWNKAVVDNPSSLTFWLDFFDADSLGLEKFSVPAIGARPKAVNKDAVRALIYGDVPDIIFVTKEDYDSYYQSGKLNILGDGYYYQIIGESQQAFFDNLIKSQRSITAQEEIDNMLYTLSYANENVTITSIPIYYLEPNTIISAQDEEKNVNGYYIIQKMTLPLTYNGTMQTTAIRVPERLY